MVGIIQEYSLLLAAIIGLAIGAPLAWSRRDKIGINTVWQFILLLALSWIFGYIGMKLVATMENSLIGTASDRRNYGFFVLEPFVLLLFGKLAKLDQKMLFDATAIYSVPTMFFGRVVCVLQGCCKGNIVPGTNFRWPIRELELLFFVVIFIVLLRMERKAKLPGQLYPVLMISYGLFRFIIQFFRSEKVIFFGMHTAHIWMIIIVCVGMSILGELRSRAACKATRESGHRRN